MTFRHQRLTCVSIIALGVIFPARGWAASGAVDTYLWNWELYFLFAIAFLIPLTLVAVWRQLKRPPLNAEWFVTSGRHLQAGLASASLVIIWAGLPATLIVPYLGYRFGLAAVYGYSVGMALPLLLLIPFSFRLRQDTPLAHTFSEWVLWRFGPQTHKYFSTVFLLLQLCYLLFAALITTELITQLTDVDPYLVLALLGLGFTLSAFMAGLRGTILAGYVQCGTFVVIALSLAVFFCNRYGDIGIYEKLSMLPGAEGTGVTLGATHGLLIGMFSLLLHLGLSFGHQAIWQHSIATTSRSGVQMLLVASLSSFAITLAVGTVFGVGGKALGIGPEQARWVMAHSVYLSLGHNALALFLLSVLFACLAIGSAEVIAGASTLITDLYRRYWMRNATDEYLLTYAKVWILLLAVGVVILGAYLRAKGIAARWLYFTSSLVVVSCLPPILVGMYWKRISSAGAFWGAFLGLWVGLGAWIGAAMWYHGSISIAFLGDWKVLFYGNLAALGASLIIMLLLSLLFPGREARPQSVDSFLSTRDIREQSIPLPYSMRSYRRYIARTTAPVIRLAWYVVGAISLVWIVLTPAVMLSVGTRVGHGLFVMWLIGALVSAMLSGGFLLLSPIVDLFQEDEPIILALQMSEREDHVPQSQD